MRIEIVIDTDGLDRTVHGMIDNDRVGNALMDLGRKFLRGTAKDGGTIKDDHGHEMGTIFVTHTEMDPPIVSDALALIMIDAELNDQAENLGAISAYLGRLKDLTIGVILGEEDENKPYQPGEPLDADGRYGFIRKELAGLLETYGCRYPVERINLEV